MSKSSNKKYPRYTRKNTKKNKKAKYIGGGMIDNFYKWLPNMPKKNTGIKNKEIFYKQLNLIIALTSSYSDLQWDTLLDPANNIEITNLINTIIERKPSSPGDEDTGNKSPGDEDTGDKDTGDESKPDNIETKTYDDEMQNQPHQQHPEERLP
jgi:hypothetical protein